LAGLKRREETRKAFLIVLSAVVFLAGSAQAATFAVETATGLQDALTTARNNGQDDLIRVAESDDKYRAAAQLTMPRSG
jgi:hypothetical protein